MKSVWEDLDDVEASKLIGQSKKVAKRILIPLSKQNDGNINITNLKQDTYNKIHSASNYTWANEEIDDLNERPGGLKNLLHTAESILKDEESKLNKSKINTNYKVKEVSGYVARPDLNSGNAHKSIISSLEFAPSKENIVVTSGLDKIMKVFSIDSLESQASSQSQTNFLYSINTNDMPIYNSKFISNQEIVLSGRRKHFYSFDIVKEKLTRNVVNLSLLKLNSEIKSLERCFSNINSDSFAFSTLEGDILLFDSKTKHFKASLKINGSVTSVVPNSTFKNYIYCSSNQGEIYLFDVRRSNQCVNKITDQGSFNTLCIDIDHSEKYFASSSQTGVVNLYNLEDIEYANKEEVDPIKVFENLTTAVDSLKFSKNGQRLAFSSKWKKNAIKIVDTSSLKYLDFPPNRFAIKYPFCFDFSCNQEYFAVGNDEGRALTYKYCN